VLGSVVAQVLVAVVQELVAQVSVAAVLLSELTTLRSKAWLS